MVGAFFEGIVLGLAISISIGPVFFALVETSISYGAKMAIAMAMGIFFSDLCLITIGHLFSSITGSLLNYSEWLKFVAAAFFIGLGIKKVFFEKNEYSPKTINNHPFGFLQYFIKGFIVNAIHPALLIFWTAMVGIYQQKYPDHFMSFFTGALSITLSMDILKSIFAWKLKSVITPKNIRRIVMVSGGIFIGFGILFLLQILGFSFENIFHR